MAKPTTKKTEEQAEITEEMEGVSFPNVNIPIVTKESLKEELEEVALVEDGVETEKQFLERLLYIQHSGGWGKHLDAVINERIKLLK